GMVYVEHNWGSAIYQSNQYNAQMGAWVCSPGDVNGDGKGDVAYGAPYWNANLGGEGAYWVRLVGSTGSWVRYGTQRSAHLGTCLAGGDYNGDGFADLGIAEPWFNNNNVTNVGRVFTYLGGGNTYYKQMPYESQLKKHNGENLGRLGRSDLGTKVTLHVERAGTAAGREQVRLEWWCRPFLDGLGHDQLSRDYTAWMPTNGPAAYGSSVPITQVISGLTPNTMYSLQWRVKSKSPYFPSTRWLCLDASGRGQADFRTAPGTVSVGDEPVLTLQPMAAFPNPFSSRTQVQFDVKETGPVSLRVLDVSGRLVRTLVDETRFSGNHESAWDGIDEHGQHVAAGVYFAHLETTEGKSVQRLTLVR
ncbi:MAG: T9SS type A sorting domain-containing protein, partial [Candidatus Eisenbacteria bacterium]|nr:T9SS type A sorting domain-containing protein [Candidatus Eisenbacteria bacterium]